jgi:hypothetical protein
MTKEQERLSPEAIANKRAYNLQYRREFYRQFAIAVPKEEFDEAMLILKKNNMSKIEFFRSAIQALNKGKFKKDV